MSRLPRLSRVWREGSILSSLPTSLFLHDPVEFFWWNVPNRFGGGVKSLPSRIVFQILNVQIDHGDRETSVIYRFKNHFGTRLDLLSILEAAIILHKNNPHNLISLTPPITAFPNWRREIV